MSVFVLLLLFQFKHFIADYPLQNAYMLGKFKDKGWVVPLSAHCAVHAVFTFIISAYFGLGLAFAMAALDFIIHFIMDRTKASPKMLGKYKAISKDEFRSLIESKQLSLEGIKFAETYPLLAEESKRRLTEIDSRFKSNTYFWWSLGLDQAVHHLTHYLIIFILVG